ncbi:magnesium chelatase domain-containing protein, partial [Microbacterium sp.]
ALFLGHGSREPGTCVTIALEGRRALPVEVQALTLAPSGPNPRRIVSGVDAARVAMVLAVLEKRAKITVSNQDVYVSTVGGVRLVEPAADLAIALAVASAVTNRATPAKLVAIGELSLAGEVRAVTQHDQRKAEAARLGYRNVIDTASRTLSGALRDLAHRHPADPGDDPTF